MAPTGPGERAVQLPWFWPDAASFRILAESPTALPWSAVRADPGLLFFLLGREVLFDGDAVGPIGAAELRAAAAILENRSAPWVAWSDPALRPVARTAQAAAEFAQFVAEATSADTGMAWAGAWLAFSGWAAVAVADPPAMARCLEVPTIEDDPFAAQAEAWGLTGGDVRWRLSSAWQMPHWARVLFGRLDATPADAAQFGGDRRLQAVVQTAVVLAEQAEQRLYVADEFDLAAALSELRLRSHDLDRIRGRYVAEVDLGAWVDRGWTDPRTEAGLRERLLEAADRLAGPPEDEDEPSVRVDVITERLQAAKLAAVAEFAAGASHEINNPLAVISGQSQYLLKHETNEERQKALQSIVRQTRRVHAVLTELMYFARPPAPRPEWLEIGRLVRDAVDSVTALAAEREVAVETGGLSGPLWIDVDPKQMLIALTALVRNAVEAAPAGGWVRVTTTFRPDRLEVAVEDNGPGPDERSRVHLFDPFYSGRAAGRGRGLGLPAAWRLAREHGGDVNYAPTPAGLTRFLLTLPASVVVTAAAQRKSA
ncbi:MAG TPA: HAMP domain-containing sensor histidine kinase [Gemmataceae bacterium]|nr:HAMP domain-containing sensor histidine kinase [Gemmataceae bacterium]